MSNESKPTVILMTPLHPRFWLFFKLLKSPEWCNPPNRIVAAHPSLPFENQRHLSINQLLFPLSRFSFTFIFLNYVDLRPTFLCPKALKKTLFFPLQGCCAPLRDPLLLVLTPSHDPQTQLQSQPHTHTPTKQDFGLELFKIWTHFISSTTCHDIIY